MSNHRNLAARRLYLGQQRRFLLRRPLPATLDPRNNLAVHSTGLLRYLQKDPASPRALPLATPVWPVQTGRLLIGVYATSINIHNPQATMPVQLTKKIAVANQEGPNRGRIVVFPVDPPLQPNQAERVDCPLIFRVLDTSATTHTEGFVVIEIPVNPNQQTFLDVVGKYSARPSTGEVSSFDVVVYSPREVTR